MKRIAIRIKVKVKKVLIKNQQEKAKMLNQLLIKKREEKIQHLVIQI